jgi:hypothetical protein
MNFGQANTCGLALVATLDPMQDLLAGYDTLAH